MYRPPDLGTNDNTRDEFVELHNITAAPVPLFDPVNPANTWRLRDAVDFDFPLNLTIAPRGTVLVVSFDPAKDAAARAAFEAKYGTGLLLFGPYAGKLDNSTDSVELYRPDPPQTLPGPDLGFVPYVLVDRVKYSDGSPWPPAADGTGPSLQRTQVSAHGNDPANWVALTFTPGQVPNPGGGDTDNDGLPDDWEMANGLTVGANDAAIDGDQDGMTNLQEYLAGTDPRNALSSFRIEALETGAQVLLRFTAQADKSYSVQVRTDLAAGDWQTLTTVPAQPAARPVEVSDPATGEAARYYRILTPATP
jgi:hypothetical protein